MVLQREWRSLVKLAEENGIGSRIVTIPEDPKTPTYGKKLRRTDPTPAVLERWLPTDYRELVTKVGYFAVDFGEGARFAFVPPRVMCQVTGAMGERGRNFDEVRKEREAGTYAWPFAFFAGHDLADVEGWCFAEDKTGAPVVWTVNESLPAMKAHGAFGPWLEKELARLAKKIETPAKAARCLRQLREDEGLEDGEKLPKLSLESFGA